MDQQKWALNALDRSVRAMRRSSSATELCQSCCDAITIDEAYPLAWIGFALNDEEHNIEIVAKSGQDTAYLAEARITWADEPNGRGLAGSAIRSGKTQVVGNVDSSPVLEPWRKVVSRAGFHSAIGIPIFDGPECFGVLMVYSGQHSAFDDDAVSVLENLAEVIGFGVSLYRTTQTLRKNEQNFRSLIEAIPDAIFLKDGDSRWEITNEPAKRLFHLHSIPWEGKTEMELADLHPEFRTAHENCLADDEKAWHARELTLFSEIVPNDEGAMRDFEVRKVPVFNEDNQRQALMIIGRDITERKHAEIALTESLRQMEMKELSRTRFLAAAGHDMRQPIAAANLFVEALQLTSLNQRQSELIDRLGQSMGIFSNMLDRLLDISRFDAGLVKPQITNCQAGGTPDLAGSEFRSDSSPETIALPPFLSGQQIIVRPYRHWPCAIRADESGLQCDQVH